MFYRAPFSETLKYHEQKFNCSMTTNITVKRSSIHHKGVFASRDIKKGEKVIEYIGEKISKKESIRRGDIVLEKSKGSKTKGAVYIFNLTKKHDLDGNVSHNDARYINHSCEPNCEAYQDDDRVWIVAMEDIKNGAELSYNYGYDFDDIEDHKCRCGSSKCVGYILDEKYWPRLEKSKKAKASA